VSDAQWRRHTDDRDTAVTTHPFRLGVSLAGQGHVAQLASQASRAEQIGFDSVLLVDHLGFSAPLSPLVAMAAAAPSVRVGTHVINASFHRPALLARERPPLIQPPVADST
jgi:alkanesulfonate monooxygenase SsuD/methylene tetrahydromethanopterin reductase-like flavin-dependent oxidoreductase (luciferase family)